MGSLLSMTNPTDASHPAELTAHKCINCAYDLAGLAADANCPECATPVAKSLGGDLLANRLPAYVSKLRRGAWMVETSINLTIGSVALFVLVMILTAVAAPTFANAIIVVATILCGLAFMLGLVLFPAGWWKLTTPDPGIDADARGQRARRLVRITVAVLVASTLISLAEKSIFRGQLYSSAAATTNLSLSSVSVLFQIMTLIAWIVQFYAAMLYVRWLARRIPDERVYKRAGRLLWLGPLLSLPVCLFILPLIAAALYGNLMQWLKLSLKAIEKQQNGSDPADVAPTYSDLT